MPSHLFHTNRKHRFWSQHKISTFLRSPFITQTSNTVSFPLYYVRNSVRYKLLSTNEERNEGNVSFRKAFIVHHLHNWIYDFDDNQFQRNKLFKITFSYFPWTRISIWISMNLWQSTLLLISSLIFTSATEHMFNNLVCLCGFRSQSLIRIQITYRF